MRKTKIVCTIGPACETAEVLEQMCIAGMTSRMVSRFRPPMDIIGFASDEKTRRKLALS